MKVLLTGGRGMLGRTLAAEWRGFSVIQTDLPEADITDPAGFEKVLEKYQPDAVVHCAAMTAVDRCESEVELAYQLNAWGTKNVAWACHKLGIRLIAISTDYVFDGNAKRPYNEFDLPNGGICVYGKSKFAGEIAIRVHCPNHVICRISWLYGQGGSNFVDTMIKLADGTRPTLKVVKDQIGNPTSTLSVAHKLEEILRHPEWVGTFHLTCEGEATWYEFAQEIFKQLHINQKVVPCTTDEFPRVARRPANSRLDNMMLRLAGSAPMPDWKDALHAFLDNRYGVSET